MARQMRVFNPGLWDMLTAPRESADQIGRLKAQSVVAGKTAPPTVDRPLRSTVKTTGLGFLAGAVPGALAGALLSDRGIKSSPSDDKNILAGRILMAVLGGAIGGEIGAIGGAVKSMINTKRDAAKLASVLRNVEDVSPSQTVRALREHPEEVSAGFLSKAFLGPYSRGRMSAYLEMLGETPEQLRRIEDPTGSSVNSPIGPARDFRIASRLQQRLRDRLASMR